MIFFCKVFPADGAKWQGERSYENIFPCGAGSQPFQVTAEQFGSQRTDLQFKSWFSSRSGMLDKVANFSHSSVVFLSLNEGQSLAFHMNHVGNSYLGTAWNIMNIIDTIHSPK